MKYNETSSNGLGDMEHTQTEGSNSLGETEAGVDTI